MCRLVRSLSGFIGAASKPSTLNPKPSFSSSKRTEDPKPQSLNTKPLHGGRGQASGNQSVRDTAAIPPLLEGVGFRVYTPLGLRVWGFGFMV